MDFVRALVLTALRIVGIFLVLLGLNALLAGEAYAQASCAQVTLMVSECPAGSPAPCSQGEAHASCMRAATAMVNPATSFTEPFCATGTGIYYPRTRIPGTGTEASCGVNVGARYNTAQTCLAQNSQWRNDPPLLQWAGSPPACVGGCTVQYSGTNNVTIGGQVVYTNAQDRYYTGDVCASPPATPPPETPQPKPDDTCAPAGGGQTFCVTPQGQHCHTTSNGKRVCWAPNETGVKDDGVDAQSRTPDGTGIVPSTPPADGSTWTSHNSHTVTVTNNGTTITYTVTNYTSTSSKPDKPITNPGDITEEDDGGDDGDGSATPATNCAETPQCSGGDAIGCAMLRQHHSMICMEGSTTPNGVPDGDPESSVTEPVSSLFTGDEGSTGDGFDLIDQDGWAGRGQCPIALTINDPFGGVHTMDESEICRLLDALAGLISLLAGIHAGVILLSGSKR